MPELDLSKPKPSPASALHFAQLHGIAHMRAAGRTKPNAEDTEVLKKELARLLWHVEFRDGGFFGGDDAQRAQIARHWKISEYADAFAFSGFGEWPGQAVAA